MKIYCCQCTKEVDARLTDGAEIYSHRPDLKRIPFWKCDACKNYVGCHWKTKDRTRPLGFIPTQQLRRARSRIHELIDPIWQKGVLPRKVVYARLSAHLGYEYRSGEIKNQEEARNVLLAVMKIKEELGDCL